MILGKERKDKGGRKEEEEKGKEKCTIELI
jgi:hypothetical protein